MSSHPYPMHAEAGARRGRDREAADGVRHVQNTERSLTPSWGITCVAGLRVDQKPAQMDLVYVDESGDPGAINSPTASYILSGLKIPSEHWHEAQARLVSFRQRMRDQLGLKLSAEIHAAEFLGGAKRFLGLEPRQRLRVALWLLRELRQIEGLSSCSVACLKHSEPEPMQACWRHLAVDLSATSDRPMLLIADVGEAAAIKLAIMEFRSSHPQQALIIEDPFHRDSRHSYFLQAVDLIAYLQRQRLHPNALFRDKRPEEVFAELDNISPPARWLA